MRTAFSEEQLTDPQLRSAEDSLRRCVHCGFCTATCPTYVLLGDERDSPRGRIALIQNMLESGKRPTAEAVHHIDRCLSCLGCRTTCPSGVNYATLVDTAREYINDNYRRPLSERMLRSFVLTVLSRPWLFSFLAVLGRALATVASSLPGRLGKMGKKIPTPHALDAEHKAVPEPASDAKRIALLPGCVQRALSPEIDASARRVLARRKLNAEPLEQSGCCGALAFHMGKADLAKKYARKMIEAFEKKDTEAQFESVSMTATGCTAFLKEYSALFAGDAEWEKRAQAFTEKVRDFVELIEPSTEPAHEIAMGDMRVAYHPPCSLQHAQKIQGRGEDLLSAAGFKLTTFADSHLCCGSAGSYSLLQPEIAKELRARKLTAIKDSGATIIASANVGCISHLSGANAPHAVHIAELLDWADGGPKPAAIKDGD
jgi:glycolate oxidase iron-sulfur subunit